MTPVVLDPDDEPYEHSKLEELLADTLKQYRLYLQAGEGKSEAAAQAGLWMTSWKHGPSLPTVQVGAVDHLVEEAERSLQADSSGKELTPIESLEKQRELLSTIAQELVGQREDARRGEADAFVHQRRALRIAVWSLGVAALALLPPIVEIVLKLLGADL